MGPYLRDVKQHVHLYGSTAKEYFTREFPRRFIRGAFIRRRRILLAAELCAVSTKLSNSLSRARLHFSSGKKVSAKRMNVCSREKARLQGCARGMAPCHCRKKFWPPHWRRLRLLPEDFASLKCSHLASLAQIGRLEKLEPYHHFISL